MSSTAPAAGTPAFAFFQSLAPCNRGTELWRKAFACLRIAPLHFCYCTHCRPVATPFTFGIAQEHRHHKHRNISCSFDCTIILRRAFTNALATHKGKRDTSETYRLKRVAIYRKTLQHSTRSPYKLNRTTHNSQWQSNVSFLRTGTPCWSKSARPVVRLILRDAPTIARPFANDARIIDEILVERRCLGQTELKVKPGQIGTSNATKPDNLGVLDYAHLRVPLPSDLSSSGIFIKGPNRKYPEAYFLMVRKYA